ncbi:unnamed protein product [Protopolystoma xenopodis]|uniref:Uncharacterized protein n=1 Tax=Protopolystoma xenopodis TaxID=117903 RepID=A0A448WEE3_9PLAT|nr:unnamed protein product [Protopolystoma xenopodis]
MATTFFILIERIGLIHPDKVQSIQDVWASMLRRVCSGHDLEPCGSCHRDLNHFKQVVSHDAVDKASVRCAHLVMLLPIVRELAETEIYRARIELTPEC